MYPPNTRRRGTRARAARVIADPPPTTPDVPDRWSAACDCELWIVELGVSSEPVVKQC